MHFSADTCDSTSRCISLRVSVLILTPGFLLCDRQKVGAQETFAECMDDAQHLVLQTTKHTMLRLFLWKPGFSKFFTLQVQLVTYTPNPSATHLSVDRAFCT